MDSASAQYLRNRRAGMIDLTKHTVVVSWIFYNVWKRLNLPVFLGTRLSPVLPGMQSRAVSPIWAGCGYRRSGRFAMAMAKKQGVGCLLLEDGFLRSIGIGMKNPPLSIVFDDKSIYYDATQPSRLEGLIGRTHTPDEIARAIE